MSKQDDLQYWAKELEKNKNQLQPLRAKLYDKIDSLTIEELYELRELIMQNASMVRLLNETVAQPDPRPRWKKTLKK